MCITEYRFEITKVQQNVLSVLSYFITYKGTFKKMSEKLSKSGAIDQRNK